jgi:formylglycine-generating enzyme required for sulfatase activity
MPENPSSVQLPAGTPVPDVPDAPDVPSKIGEPAASRDCQLPRAGTAAGYPVMIQIDKGNYVLKKTSHRARITPLLQAAGVADVVVTEPFLIQSREVTVDAFRVFVNAVAGWPEGPDKQRVQMYIGTQWGRAHQSVQERMEGGARVAMGLSREAAEEYVAWLSQTTGCAYRLPTREQWGAAVMSGVAAEDPQFLDALLHGAREWSNSRCPGGYVLLGEDPEASTADVARTRCMPAMLPVAGFRVLLSGEKKR